MLIALFPKYIVVTWCGKRKKKLSIFHSPTTITRLIIAPTKKTTFDYLQSVPDYMSALPLIYLRSELPYYIFWCKVTNILPNHIFWYEIGSTVPSHIFCYEIASTLPKHIFWYDIASTWCHVTCWATRWFNHLNVLTKCHNSASHSGRRGGRTVILLSARLFMFY